MDAVGALLEKYNIAESAQFQAGEFASPEFAELYKDLVNMGMASEDKALYVGATIEDLDISDLRRQLDLVDNRDIQMVFGNLLRGSMNHLRAFNRLLAGDYVAQYLTQEEVDEIISMPAERGGDGVRNRQSGECGTERGPGNGQCRRRGSPGN